MSPFIMKHKILDYPNLINSSGKVSSGVFPRFKKSDLYSELLDATSFLPKNTKPSQRIWHVMNDVNEVVLCLECSKHVRFQTYVDGYRTFCSPSCSSASCNTQLKMKQTKLERYSDENYTNPLQSKQTKLERYGDENYTNKPKAKQTKLERYGNEHYNNPEQTRKTCSIKYGSDNYMKTEDFQVKSKATKFNLHGNENYNNREQAEQTSMEIYGVSNPSKHETIKAKIIIKINILSYL